MYYYQLLFYINLVFVILAETVNIIGFGWKYALGAAVIYLVWVVISARIAMKFISGGEYRTVQYQTGSVQGSKLRVPRNID